MSLELKEFGFERHLPEPDEDCIHEEVDYTDRIRLTNPDIVETWIPGSPVVPGSEWCWSHGRWEAQEIR